MIFADHVPERKRKIILALNNDTNYNISNLLQKSIIIICRRQDLKKKCNENSLNKFNYDEGCLGVING